jgi:hypothetical protein
MRDLRNPMNANYPHEFIPQFAEKNVQEIFPAFKQGTTAMSSTAPATFC